MDDITALSRDIFFLFYIFVLFEAQLVCIPCYGRACVPYIFFSSNDVMGERVPPSFSNDVMGECVSPSFIFSTDVMGGRAPPSLSKDFIMF